MTSCYLRTVVTTVSTISICLLGAPFAGASPIYYNETRHYYDFIWAGQITWTDANVAASTHEHRNQVGYLATISSQGENDFLYRNFGHIFWEGWLGGWQDLNSSSAANWHWVTAEPWTYVNWARGEPNDAGGTGEERYLQMWGFGTVAPGQWNDDANDTHLGNIGGFLVEYGDQMAPIPEPSTLTLTGIGLGLAAARRAYRRRARSARASSSLSIERSVGSL